MPRQINFLAARQKTITKQTILDMQFMRIAGIFFAVAVVFALVLVLVFLFFRNQWQSIKDQESNLRAQITTNRSNEEAQVTYIRKLTTLAKIYQNRQDKNNIISYFSALFGSKAVIVGIDFDQKEDLLHFKVQSVDVFAWRQVLEIVNGSQVKADFPALTLSNLNRQDNASYTVVMSVPVTKAQTP